jgi:hypothetical protein
MVWRANFACITVGAIVLAFMAISLAITTVGTARFATALGYPAATGYAVGTILDLGKAILLVGVLMLFARRAFLLSAVLGLAWVGLVTFTALATSATVGAAITAVERNGTWAMETRTNAETELASVQQRLAALSQPAPPRPAATVAQALRKERVPAGVWRDSQECENMRMSRHFQTECAHVLRLRQELVAAKDYEGLEARARELRHTLSNMPILAVQDPLPRAFAATLGMLVRVDGDLGIAQLLTLVIEIISCVGLAAVRVLWTPSKATSETTIISSPPLHSGQGLCSGATTTLNATSGIIPDERIPILPGSSPNAACLEAGTFPRAMPREVAIPPSNVVPSVTKGRHASTHREAGQGRSRPATPSRPDPIVHVREFARARLRDTAGTSLSASELRTAYEEWCMSQGREPLSQRKLGAELTALGFIRFKSYGLIRYRNVQLVPQHAPHARSYCCNECNACQDLCRGLASQAIPDRQASLAEGG